MRNLDSILKSRHITLLAKVHIVKAIGLPVVMYRCESWTIKQAEHQRIAKVILKFTTERVYIPSPKLKLSDILTFVHFGH